MARTTRTHDQPDSGAATQPRDAPALERATFVVFRVDDAHYALPVARVVRTMPLPQLTRVPGAEPGLLGVCQHGGRIVSVWDTRAAFQAGNDPPAQPWLLLVEAQGRVRGLLVDDVADVLAVPEVRLREDTTTVATAKRCTEGILVPPRSDELPDAPEASSEDVALPPGLDQERAEARALHDGAASLATLDPVSLLDLDRLFQEVAP